MTTLISSPVTQVPTLKTRLIDGRHVEYLETRVAVSDLVLDPKNPRIQYALKTRFGNVAPTDEQIAELLWEDDDVKRLAATIKQSGGITDSLFVKRLHGADVLVLEGNRRTVSMRHLLAKDPTNPSFATVSVCVFGEDLTACEKTVLLSGMHVGGKREWAAYEQAQQMYELANEYGKTQDWLATELGMTKSKVCHKMAAYEALTDYLKCVGDNDPRAISKFSFFEELMKKRPLKELYLSDADFKRRFQQWVKHGKLIDSKDSRHLKDVLDSPDALEALETKGIAAAEAVLAADSPELASSLFAAIKKATEAISKAPASDMKELKFGDVKKTKIVLELHRALQDMALLGGFKL
jgi:hypothetical protein